MNTKRTRQPYATRPSKAMGFTLMEMIAVVIIMGVLAGLAIPKFTKTLERAHLDDAMTQLKAIHAANQVYKARMQTYWPPDNNGGSGYNVTAINSNLNLNIVENGMTYSCSGTGTTFTCTAQRNPPAARFTVTVTQNPLGPDNPRCSGACP